jgi:hypothetical protein
MSIGDNGMEDDAQSADRSAFPPKNPMSDVYDDDDPTWPMVVVQWRDAHSGGDASWTLTDGYEPEVVMPITVGWVWPRCKPGYMTLVGTVMNDAEEPEVVGDINHIPWENIVNVYSLAIHMPVNWNQELD